MKVLITCLYDARDEEEARELSKLFTAPSADLPDTTYTIDFLNRIDKEHFSDVGRGAGIAQFRSTQ